MLPRARSHTAEEQNGPLHIDGLSSCAGKRRCIVGAAEGAAFSIIVWDPFKFSFLDPRVEILAVLNLLLTSRLTFQEFVLFFALERIYVDTNAFAPLVLVLICHWGSGWPGARHLPLPDQKWLDSRRQDVRQPVRSPGLHDVTGR